MGKNGNTARGEGDLWEGGERRRYLSCVKKEHGRMGIRISKLNLQTAKFPGSSKLFIFSTASIVRQDSLKYYLKFTFI